MGSYVTFGQLANLGAMRTWVKAMSTSGEIFEGWKDEVDEKIAAKGLTLSQYLITEERDYVPMSQKVLDFFKPLATQWAESGQLPGIPGQDPAPTPDVGGAGSTGGGGTGGAKYANIAIIAGIGVVTILGIWMLTKKK